MVGMVRGVQAGEGHARDEAAPQVRAQEVSDGGIDEQQRKHEEEERLVRGRDLRALGLLGHLCQDVILQEEGPKLHRQHARKAHESNADDRGINRLEGVELTAQAEENIEEHQGQDVIHEGGCDDGLAEVLLEHPRFPQQAQSDAHTGGCKGSPRRDAVGHEGPAKGHGQQGAENQRQDGAQDSDAARRRAHNLGFLKVEVHAALEDHEPDTCMANQREEVWE
mmetsp:Transcript_95414/g.227264  ORF Transcript_95414/g.227264 Transcript_95414/m.227264 type:complete len:223 (+) Transcript_95414:957-1625(+)